MSCWAHITATTSPTVLFFFDVLGFSERVAEMRLSAILPQYQSLADLVNQRAGGRVVMTAVPVSETETAPIAGFLFVEGQYFSDTILRWTDYEPIRLEICVDLMLDFFCECFRAGQRCAE